MGPKEKYSIIVNTIEDLVQGKVVDGAIVKMDEWEISERAFEAAASIMDDRSKNVLFYFLLGKTVLDYIKERKFVAAYHLLLDAETLNEDIKWSAVELVGCSNFSSFRRLFSKYLNVSFSDVYSRKDTSFIPSVIAWDDLSKERKSMVGSFGEENMVETKFGISKEKFMLASVAANLQSFYNLNDYESELAFKLSEERRLSLNEAFEYIYNYVWSYLDEEGEERDSHIEEDLMDESVIYMYFNCKMKFNDIVLVLLAMRTQELPRDIEHTDRFYLLGFASYCESYEKAENECSYEELYTYYFSKVKRIDSEEDDFKRYILLSKVFGKEEALESVLSCDKEDYYYETDDLWDESDEYYEMQDYDYEPDFDDMEMQEDLWMNHDSSERRRDLMEEDRYLSEFDMEELYKDDEEESGRKLTICRGFNLDGMAKEREKICRLMEDDDEDEAGIELLFY